MTRSQILKKARRRINSPMRLIVPAFILAVSSAVSAQDKSSQMMPYTTVDHPEFVSASQATFLTDADLVIGVSSGNVAKAYPAADLAQHGVVQDQMHDGPIAVTW